MSIMKTAIKERWNITEEMKANCLKVLKGLLDSDDDAVQVAAVRCVLAAEKQNQDEALGKHEGKSMMAQYLQLNVQPTAPDPDFIAWKQQKLMEEQRRQLEGPKSEQGGSSARGGESGAGGQVDTDLDGESQEIAAPSQRRGACGFEGASSVANKGRSQQATAGDGRDGAELEADNPGGAKENGAPDSSSAPRDDGSPLARFMTGR